MQTATAISNDTRLALLINNIRVQHLSLSDWQNEKLNFIPLRGSWFANSEADFDLDEQIDRFIPPQNNKKVMLLMGDSGAGKSLYTQGLVNKLWQNFTEKFPIPIWISLPSLKGPVNKIIEETFEKYGFNTDQIEELRKTRSFLFILDAYDEIRCEKNLFQTNNFDKWNAKIIITCRREYLYHKDNYKLFFAPFLGDKIQYSQYEEIYVRPFNVNQIKSFVQQYIKAQKTIWDNPERYQKAIEDITGLRELIKTPFILKLTVEVLPEIAEKYAIANQTEKKQVTQAALYDVFIEQWFIRQERKLKEAKLIGEDDNIKPEFWVYAKELSTQMYKFNVTQVVYNSNEGSDLFSNETIENPWDKFFSPKNPRIELLRTACLVREVSQYHYAFIHSSLSEYFLTRKLYENIVNQALLKQSSIIINPERQEGKQNTLLPLTVINTNSSNLSITKNRHDQSTHNASEDYFNQRLFVKEANTIQFLADRIAEQKDFKKLLFDRVYASKNNPNNQVSAANAITILNKAKVSLSELDFSNIHIPEADLRFAFMENTNLSKSNLSHVYLKQAYLAKANLAESNMSNVDFGELPILEYRNENIISMCYTLDGHYLILATEKSIDMWDDSKRKSWVYERKDTVKHLTTPFFKISCLALNPDGKILAYACHNLEVKKDTISFVVLWDIENFKKIIEIKIVEWRIESLSFKGDGTILAMNYCHGIKFLSLTQILNLKPEKEDVNLVALYNLTHVHAVEYNPQNNEMIAIVSGCNVRLYNAFMLENPKFGELVTKMDNSDKPKIPRLQNVDDEDKAKKFVKFSPDGNLLVISTNKAITFWDVNRSRLIRKSIIRKSESPSAIEFSEDSKLLAYVEGDKTILIWSIEDFKHFCQPFLGHQSTVNFLKFNPDASYLMSGSKDGTVRSWRIESLSLNHTISQHTGIIQQLIFNKGDKLLVSVVNNQLYIWDMSKGAMINLIISEPDQHKSAIIKVAVSPDNEILVTGDSEKNIHFWYFRGTNSSSNVLNLIKKVSDHREGIRHIAFSPDSRLMASCSNGHDRNLLLWQINKTTIDDFIPLLGYESKQDELRNKENITSISFSSDGQLLACGTGNHYILLFKIDMNLFASDRLAQLAYNVERDQASVTLLEEELDKRKKIQIRRLLGHNDAISHVQFSPKYNLLASYSSDKSIRLWNMNEINISCATLTGHSGAVSSISFHPEGKLLVSGSQDKTIRTWRLEGEIQCVQIFQLFDKINWVTFNSDGNNFIAACSSLILFWQKDLQGQNNFALIKSFGTCPLNVHKANFTDVQGLSTANIQLMNQLEAIVDKQAYERLHAEEVKQKQLTFPFNSVTVENDVLNRSDNKIEEISRQLVFFRKPKATLDITLKPEIKNDITKPSNNSPNTKGPGLFKQEQDKKKQTDNKSDSSRKAEESNKEKEKCLIM